MSYQRLAQSIGKQIQELKEDQKDKLEKFKTNDIISFIDKYIALPIKAPPTQKSWFENREYLFEPYRDQSKEIIIVKGRQMEFTEYAVNQLIYWALTRPGTYVYATSTIVKAKTFSKDRLRAQIIRSPEIKPFLLNRETFRFILGQSQIYLTSSYGDANSLRGIAADGLILDEFQDATPESLSIAAEVLSHSYLKKLWLIGTPTVTGTKFEEYWNLSDKKEWDGTKWIKTTTKTPEELRFSGYHISQELAVGKWLTQDDLNKKKLAMPAQQYANEVLGVFYSGLGRPQTPQLLWKLFDPSLPKGEYKKGDLLVAGVDWGVGLHAHTVFWLTRPRLVESPDVFAFDCIYFEKIENPDLMEHVSRVIKLCNTYPITLVCCDRGAGYVQNQYVWKALQDKMMLCEFINRPMNPMEIVPSAYGNVLKADRTWALDTSLDLLTKPGRVRFYNILAFETYKQNTLVSTPTDWLDFV
jgi:hypothetical protein